MQVGLANELAALWESSDSPPDVFAFLQQYSGATVAEQIDLLLTDQYYRWQTRQPISVEQYLARLPHLSANVELKLLLAAGECQARSGSDDEAGIDELTARFSDIHGSLLGKLSELFGAQTGLWRPDRLFGD